MTYTLTCQHCGSPFERSRADAATCSAKCRRARARYWHKVTGEPPRPGKTNPLPLGRELFAVASAPVTVDPAPAEPVEVIQKTSKTLKRVRKTVAAPRKPTRAAPKGRGKKPRPKGRSPR